jgi:hypothetical protein
VNLNQCNHLTFIIIDALNDTNTKHPPNNNYAVNFPKFYWGGTGELNSTGNAEILERVMDVVSNKPVLIIEAKLR